MGQPNRLASGGLIDRTTPLAFTFDGREYAGHPGDTLASALIANGVGLVGRSFKYHRPRGILSAGSEEPNALVELRSGARREPNAKATTVELYDGLEARSQNRWPSLSLDLMAATRLFGPALAAGFYYKTFMWPAAFWEKVYEPLIRRAAGLGRAAEAPDPDAYEKATAFCDVLVIGAGPAGLAAALAAGRGGARVILAEDDVLLGGRLIADSRAIDGAPSAEWVARAEAELRALADVMILSRTSVFGVYDSGVYGALERVSDHFATPLPHQPRQRLWRIVARRAVLAAGALERPIAFSGNDTPGVMLAGAVRTYLNRFGVAPGGRTVVYANNDDAALTVNDLDAAGCEVVAVVDARSEARALHAAARDAGATLVFGGAITRVRGAQAVVGCEIADAHGRALGIACDLIAVSGGWNPSLQLSTHLGGRPIWRDSLAAFVPGPCPPGMVVAGAAAGAYRLRDALAEGARAGAEAARRCGHAGEPFEVPDVAPEAGVAHGRGPWRAPAGRGKAFVDFQNDVTVADIELAAREGFTAVEHLKRYTTLGMATDQGKTANVVGLALMAEIAGRTIPEIGSTVARPPFTPVAIGAFAGAHRHQEFRPIRLPPSHQWAEEQGAVFVESGLWLRAAYFPRRGEAGWLETVSREVAAVRAAVGVCDVSTLGKIDVQGADAAAFLDRVYVNAISTLAVGRARYGLMLREDGFAMDDGTVARLGATHFVVTTTTANAAAVLRHLEFCRQWLWPATDVRLACVSDQWAQYAIAGPCSREVLEALVDDATDVSDAAVPYMGAVELKVCGGVRARLFRLSFSGERAYELAVPARFGDALIRRVMQTGAPFGICPYGVEALGVMRIEKGHPGGAELNGETTAADLGLGRMMSVKKDFVGRTLARREALVDPARPALVGLRPVDRAARLRAGAHLAPMGAKASAATDQGHVTSVAFSPGLGCWIGLALLARGRDRMGETVRAVDPVRAGDVAVEVVPPVFVDPEGARLRG